MSSFLRCPDDNPQANSNSHVLRRAVLEGRLPLVSASNKTWHPAVSAAPETGPEYLAKQKASLAPGGLGRKPSLAHDPPLCSSRRGSRALSTSVAPHISTTSATASFPISQFHAVARLERHRLQLLHLLAMPGFAAWPGPPRQWASPPHPSIASSPESMPGQPRHTLHH